MPLNTVTYTKAIFIHIDFFRQELAKKKALISRNKTYGV